MFYILAISVLTSVLENRLEVLLYFNFEKKNKQFPPVCLKKEYVLLRHTSGVKKN